MSHVDSTSPITHVSLCAGYGGIDLGLKRAIPSLRTIAFSEIEAFACANLVSKMEAGLLDPAPIWTDLKTFPWAEFHGRVDILSGGYPCQPFSAAGKRLGAEDPRHLWPFIAAGIAAMRPGACFFENVEGHISLGLPDVLQDLAGMGYRTTWCVASASECGAPHQRKRIFILAECSSQRGASGLSRSLAGHEGFAGIADNCGGEGCGELANALRERRQQDAGSAPSYEEAHGRAGWNQQQPDSNHVSTGHVQGTPWPSRPGEQQFAWEPPRVVGNANELRPQGRHDTGSLQAMGISRAELTGANSKHRRGSAESSLGRNAARTSGRLDHAVLHVSTDNRTDELRLLGNGVVPATAERAFRVLVGELMEATT
jgi:DNA (cytosine-5)-methyltransferase 1